MFSTIFNHLSSNSPRANINMSLSKICENYGGSQSHGQGSEKGSDGDFSSLTTCKDVDNKSTLKLYKGRKANSDITDQDAFRCPFCPLEIFERASDLIHHLKSHNPNYVEETDFPGVSSRPRGVNSENPTSNHTDFSVCIFCLKCPEKREFENHIRSHIGEKPFSCRYCGNSYTATRSLRKHLRKTSMHKKLLSGAKPSMELKCEHCQMCFRNSFLLKRHIRSHTGEKPFSCNICSKSFSQNSHVQLHGRTHTGEKRFQCTCCKKGFGRKAELKRHLLIHAEEKPFCCALCPKGFRNPQNLQRHILIHTGELPYECHLCSYNFNQSSNLKRHMKNVHKV